jgi:low temperature requirement protein LtrA
MEDWAGEVDFFEDWGRFFDLVFVFACIGVVTNRRLTRKSK